jgi:YD repeat-containing protein
VAAARSAGIPPGRKPGGPPGDGPPAWEADGAVWAWGDGADGQLGNGGTSDSAGPVRVSGLVGAVAISAGQDHSLALDGNGQVWGWGANNDGQLGDGTTTTRTTAVPANTAPGMTTLAAGSWHSLTLATTRSFTNTYTYDGLDRLVSGGIPGFPQGYTDDPVGNRLSLTRGPNVTPNTYDKADRIETAGSTPYTVDANGNVVARDQDRFSDDQANRLVSAAVGGTTTTYSYDGDGKRASKTVGTGSPITYTYDVNQWLPMLLSDGTRNYVSGLGLAFSVDTSGNLAVYHTDGLGSVRALTDPNGNIVQTYQADEFGVPALVQGASAQPFGYAGQQADAESGFQYLRSWR